MLHTDGGKTLNVLYCVMLLLQLLQTVKYFVNYLLASMYRRSRHCDHFVCLCVCPSVLKITRESVDGWRPNLVDMGNLGRDDTIEVFKFSSWSNSRYGCRITFPLCEIGHFTTICRISHTVISQLSPNLVTWFTPTTGHIQYILPTSRIGLLISLDIWIHFWIWIGIPDGFDLY